MPMFAMEQSFLTDWWRWVPVGLFHIENGILVTSLGLHQDVVSENNLFDVDNFIVLLRDRMLTKVAYVRTFLVSWVGDNGQCACAMCSLLAFSLLVIVALRYLMRNMLSVWLPSGALPGLGPRLPHAQACARVPGWTLCHLRWPKPSDQENVSIR